jgi:hypothetical protein
MMAAAVYGSGVRSAARRILFHGAFSMENVTSGWDRLEDVFQVIFLMVQVDLSKTVQLPKNQKQLRGTV